MAVTSGDYTVGSSGNYTTWKLALDDVYRQSLTGNITFTQISDTTETSAWPKCEITNNGYTMKMTSNNPHFGDPTKGWKITSSTGRVIWIAWGSTGLFEICNLNFDFTGAAAFNQIVCYGAGKSIIIHDNICLFGSTGSNFVEINTNENVTCYNNIVYIGNMYSRIGGYYSNKNFYNCSQYSGTQGFHNSAFNLYNCASFGNSTLDFGTMTGTFTKCASSDASGSEASLRSLTTANCFKSVDPANSGFLDILQGGDLWEKGSSDLASNQTTDIRGRTIPNGMGLYSIGASTAWNRALLLSNSRIET